MKREALKERVELLEIGEQLGYPRLSYGRSTKVPHDKRIPPGKDGWERFCAHAHVARLLPALRIGRTLALHGVSPFHPLSVREISTTQTIGGEIPVVIHLTQAGADLLEEIANEGLVTDGE